MVKNLREQSLANKKFNSVHDLKTNFVKKNVHRYALNAIKEELLERKRKEREGREKRGRERERERRGERERK